LSLKGHLEINIAIKELISEIALVLADPKFNHRGGYFMKVLLVEDEFISRKILLAYFYKQSEYGCDVATNGSEAIEAFMLAIEGGKSGFAYIMLGCKLVDVFDEGIVI
jgi:hypothetical protein